MASRSTQRMVRIRPDSSRLDLSQLPYQAPSVFNYLPPGPPATGIPELHHVAADSQRQIVLARGSDLYAGVCQPISESDVPAPAQQRVEHLELEQHDLFVQIRRGSLGTIRAGQTTFPNCSSDSTCCMCHGSLSEPSKSAINNALVAACGNTNASELARLAIFGVFGTPECAIDE